MGMEKICYNCFTETLNETGICTRCGYDGARNREKFPQALPQGSILYGRYIIGRVLGQGGFGITYLAQDYQTKERVAIKEFFPDTMAARTGGTTVTPFSGERGENFAYGRNTFLEEAKTMAEFIGNPNIVRVHSYFEENGTGYFVMEYLDGVSFQQYIKDHGGRISWAETLKIMLPILDALSAMHTKGIIHRDVTPDNIYITKEGAVKLLDFGAARYSLGNVSRSLDVILKHGFAPKEQYKRHGRQGPYTDVYSTAATIYYAVTGTKPDDAIERSDEDNLPLPTTLGARITLAQEKVLLKGLAVQPEDRYQTMDAFRDALTGAVQPEPVNKTTPKPVVKNDQKEQKTAGRKNLPRWLIPACAAAVLVFVALQIGMSMGRSSKDSPVVQSPLQTETASQTEALQQTVLETLPTETQPTYVMMASRGLYSNEPFWGQITYRRSAAEAVRFEIGLKNAPSDAWDVSEAADGSIQAWMDNDGVLHVASDGIIALNPDSAMLFAYFSNLKGIDFGTVIDTSQVTDMRQMFYGCDKLTSLDLSGFDTSQVTDMGGMFSSCSSLTNLDVSGFDTSQVTDMSSMFSACRSLSKLDVSGFDTSKVTDMRQMFYRCSTLTSLDVSGFDTSQVADMSDMFYFCSSLTSLDLSGFDTSKVTDMGRMFANCSSLTSLDVSSFDTSQVTDMSEMFYDCSNLTSLDVSGFDTSQVTDMEFMFYDCNSLTSLDVSSFDTAKVTTMYAMFSGCSNLTSLDVSGFDTSQVTSMGDMFEGCGSLASLDVSGFDTSQVTDMGDMFSGCDNVTSLDLSSFDTSQVTDMEDMFCNCINLTSLDVGGFDTSQVTDMSGMFFQCLSLTSLDVSGFDTSQVTDMEDMFCNCFNLTSLDVSGFDTSKVTNMDGMFYCCSSLVSLDMSGFDASEVTDIVGMFDGCSSLKNLICSDRKIRSVYDERYVEIVSVPPLPLPVPQHLPMD